MMYRGGSLLVYYLLGIEEGCEIHDVDIDRGWTLNLLLKGGFEACL